MTVNAKTVISVDAMGNDRELETILSGIAICLKKRPETHFLLFGNEADLKQKLQKFRHISKNVTLCPCKTVVTMDQSPSDALRNGKESSMWGAINAVAEGRVKTAVSCGNTGALMAISTFLLDRLPNVRRPAIAVLWPSLSQQKYNLLLDAGAGITADPNDLEKFAYLGALFAKLAFSLPHPRVGILNIGVENHKGLNSIKKANNMLQNMPPNDCFEYIGFVEGNEIPQDRADVIVTDGFSGNIALKTAEGTAEVIGKMIKDAFSNSLLSKFAFLFAITSMNRLKRRIDPRRANGGVFLGLNGTIIKSHGAADKIGFASALELAIRVDQNALGEKMSETLAETQGVAI